MRLAKVSLLLISLAVYDSGCKECSDGLLDPSNEVVALAIVLLSAEESTCFLLNVDVFIAVLY